MSLVAFAVIGRGGPGFIFYSLFGALVLMFCVPLLQGVLLATTRFRGRYVLVAKISVAIGGSTVLLPLVFGGLFNVG